MPAPVNVVNVPVPGSPRFERDTAMAIARLKASLGPTSSPTFDSPIISDLTISDTLSLTGLTASRLVATDSDQILVSVSNLASWVAGTANRVTVTNDGDGTITLSGPQDLHTGATPTFAGLTDSGLTASRLMSSDGSKVLTSVSNLTTWVKAGTGITSTDGGDGTTTIATTITQYTDALARAAISNTATGLTYTAATGVLSLTSGYVIPTTTEESNWNTAYGWGNWAHTTLAGYGITDACPLAHKTTEDAINGLVSVDGAGAYSAKVIGSDVQAYEAGLAAIAGLAKTDSNFIVGNGSTWVAESGATVRTSLGLGTADIPQFAGIISTGQINATINSGLSPTTTGIYNALSDSGNFYGFMTQCSQSSGNSIWYGARKSRGSIASPSDVANGDTIGSFLAQCYSGSAWFSTAAMVMTVDGTFTSGQRPPSRFDFYTNVANGAQTIRMTLSGSGLLTVTGAVRSNTAFNINGTAGLSQTTANPGSITSSGGIITAMSANPYGSMYADNIAHTVTVSASDTLYEVDGDITGGTESGMTFQNSKEIKCLTAGKYLATYAISINADGVAQKEIESDIMINGTETGLATSHSETGIGADRPQTNAGTAILTLAANDVVSLGVANHTDTTDIVVEHVSMTLVKVGS